MKKLIVKRTLLSLIVLGVLAGSNVYAEEDSALDKTENGLKKGGKAAESGIKKGAKAAGKGIEKGGEATAKGVKKAGKWVGEKLDKVFK